MTGDSAERVQQTETYHHIIVIIVLLLNHLHRQVQPQTRRVSKWRGVRASW